MCQKINYLSILFLVYLQVFPIVSAINVAYLTLLHYAVRSYLIINKIFIPLLLDCPWPIPTVS